MNDYERRLRNMYEERIRYYCTLVETQEGLINEARRLAEKYRMEWLCLASRAHVGSNEYKSAVLGCPVLPWEVEK